MGSPALTHPASNWAGRHAALLVLAGLLVGADVIALLWTREGRHLFGRH
jgi:hypothetical protein